ncbi:zinc transport system substrate-binding protein [Marinobacter daqiaonensis]|uniref:High-affinity zinc uptake system protein ZnuA n=1 Tax=Marinobacter daqiaonensis TaxID=650891 RepID=A0A1I6H4E5_9GAMM|nr:zinc ABC transporter substrate-binding protein [Marinobacter daqiaonensis]SFR49335.1 zinc transport system substrate-binding protein [Marinobacter daqiaonensis]
MSMVSSYPRFLLACCLFLVLAINAAHAKSEDNRPIVIASLKPVELLVRAVAGDQVEVHSLVPAGSSPHTYQLRPSERRLLEESDAIFWIGPEMETFLTRLLDGADFRARSLALAPAAVKTEGEGGSHTDHGHDDDRGHNDDHSHDDDRGYDDGHGHDDHHGHEPSHDSGRDNHHDKDQDHHGHDHGDGPDPHLWLDPAMALQMAQAIAGRLKKLEGTDSEQIEANLAAFTRNLESAEADIGRRLEPARHLDIFTYHNAFGQFAEHYGLEIAGVLTMSPERSPGARHLSEVQDRLRKAQRPCLLTEPQFNRQWWRSLMEGIQMPLSTWDPLAGDIETTSQGYIKFQYSLAEAVLRCLPEDAQ